MREKAVSIVQKLRQAGYEAVFAGGCVRDMLLGKEPKDFDIATSARPEAVQRVFPGSRAVGAHFGVILVFCDGVPFEIATFRRDGSYSDGRRPDSVEYTSAEEDAKRRDFTINGLFFDPVSEEVKDYIGGQVDLKARLIRAIGNPVERFKEDRLRLLRAVRFAASLGFEIERDTWLAIQELAADVLTVSAERIRDELTRIFLHPSRVRGFDLLVESGLMQAVLPEILKLKGCEQPPQWHPEGDVFVHTRIMLGLLDEEVSLPLVLSVLFHDIAKPDTFTVDETGRIRFNGHDRLGAEKTGDILRRLKYPNDVIDPTVIAVDNHMKFKDVKLMRTSTLKRFLARPTLQDELELHRVDCTSSNGLLDNYDYLQDKLSEFATETPQLMPTPFLNGHDLIALGVQPGPQFREILDEALNRQMEGVLTSREEAMEWLNQQVTH